MEFSSAKASLEPGCPSCPAKPVAPYRVETAKSKAQFVGKNGPLLLCAKSDIL